MSRELPSWLEFLDQFPSSKVYGERLEKLVDWHYANKENAGNIPLYLSVDDYIKANHIKDDKGKFKLANVFKI